MINYDPNMSRKQITEEMPLPTKLEQKGIFTLIYKGVFIAVKLLLDIRLNLVKISEGKVIKTSHKSLTNEYTGGRTIKKQSNPVIKKTDKIK